MRKLGILLLVGSGAGLFWQGLNTSDPLTALLCGFAGGLLIVAGLLSSLYE